MKNILYLLLACFLVSSAPGAPLYDSEPQIRVRIINTLDTLRLRFEGEWSLKEADSTLLTFFPGHHLNFIKGNGCFLLQDSLVSPDAAFNDVFLVPKSASATLGIASVPFGVGWWWGGVEDRVYEGLVHIYLDSAQDLCVTVHLPLEQYLKGVVPYEIGGESPPEALKAQAVAARSEAIIALTSQLYCGEYHDLTADVECQVFSGNLRRTPASDQAVDATRSLILAEKGLPINAYYASNCGGHAELIENVWPQRPRPASYEAALPDRTKRKQIKLDNNWRMRLWLWYPVRVNCNPKFESVLPSWSRSNFRWSREFTTEEITQMLSGGADLGQLKRIVPLKRGVSGRIYQARLVFEKGERLVDGELTLRQLFNPSLRSSAFVVQKRWGRFVLRGAGWGHGVGMCQSGALAMASQGASFEDILDHYYSAAELMRVYDAGQQ